MGSSRASHSTGMRLTINRRISCRKAFVGALLLSLGLACAPRSNGQSVPSGNSAGDSNKASIMLAATLPSQLRLSLSDALLDIKVSDPAQRSTIVALPVTSSWVLDASCTNVELVAFFDSPMSALSDSAGDVVPANHVLGGLTEDDMMPFTETGRTGTASASRTMFSQSISRSNVSSSRTDTLQIQLNSITDLGAPAGEYRGVLHLRLIAF
jgi:hypothetical protein